MEKNLVEIYLLLLIVNFCGHFVSAQRVENMILRYRSLFMKTNIKHYDENYLLTLINLLNL